MRDVVFFNCSLDIFGVDESEVGCFIIVIGQVSVVFKYSISYDLVEEVVFVLISSLVQFVFSEVNFFVCKFFERYSLFVDFCLEVFILFGGVGKVNGSVIICESMVVIIESKVD